MSRYFIHLYGNVYLDLEKARKMPIGTVSKGRKKIAEGKWVKVKGEIKKVQQEKPKNQTDTPEFKKWFGNSKVVDENGKPLVVYHSSKKNFTKFEKKGQSEGFFFSVNYNVDMFPKLGNIEMPHQFNSHIMPVYLSMNKIKKIDNISHNPLDENFEIKKAKKEGYDGMLVRGDTYIAFSPTQIKSATGNKGTFDPNNPDMTKARIK